MKVLLTGAFGNIGMSTIEELLKQGHQVVCFDLKTKANQRAAQVFKNRLQIRWGNIRNPNELKAAVIGQEAVIHLAAIIPPQADLRPQLAEEVNIGGTRNLLEVLEALTEPPRLIYASSMAVYGHTQDQEPPRTINDPINPFEPYAKHKAQCEQLIRASKLPWAILRLSAVPMLNQPLLRATVRLMFEAGPHNRIEFVHSRDVGLALAKSPVLTREEALPGVI